jgi:RimJ/RimL family protein N-acetyltransferase
MAEFFVTLSRHEMAAQIAALLNMQNKLYKSHAAYTIMNSATNYFVEIEGNRVVGCTGLLKEFPTLSKSYHTSVHPTYQSKGLGTKLLATAIANCETEYIYGTIREDNPASIRLVSKFGWKHIKKHWNRDHFVITMAGRRT